MISSTINCINCIKKRLPRITFYFLVFIMFSYILHDTYPQNINNPLMSDTRTYLENPIKSPWNSARTPGFFLYLATLNVNSQIIEFIDNVIAPLKEMVWSDTVWNIIKSGHPINIVFRKFRLVNITLMAAGLTFLSFVLGNILSPSQHTRITNNTCQTFSLSHKYQWILAQLGSLAMLAYCVRFGKLHPMDHVAADTLVAILTPFSLAFLLLFFQNRKFRWLLAASLVAAYAFLTKPAFAFLPFICGLVCICELGKNLWRRQFDKARSALLTGVLLGLTTLAWPLWLYWHGGFFVPSQLSAYNNFCFAFYLIKPGDEHLFKDEQPRAFIKKILDLQPKIAEWAKQNGYDQDYPPADLASLQQYFRLTLNEVIWCNVYRLLADIGIPYSILSYNKFISSVFPTIAKAHFRDQLRIITSSFLGAFNLLPPTRPANALWISNHYLRTFTIICLALLFGLRQFKTPILLFALTHILHMAFCSIGLCIEPRYVASTEFLMLLAFLLSLASLALRLFRLLELASECEAGEESARQGSA